MSLPVQRARLLGALRSRQEASVITGGRGTVPAVEAIEEASREALEAFMAAPQMTIIREWAEELGPDAQAYQELVENVIRRLFLRSVVTLNVASKLDVEQAQAINRVVDKILALLFALKPKLRLVR